MKSLTQTDHALIETLVNYMFLKDKAGAPDAIKCSELWFKKSAIIDRDIRDRFGEHVEHAISGEYNHWMPLPIGCVALMILVDQFPRNIYRDTSAMFAGEAVALEIVNQAHDWQLVLSPVHQLFTPGLILTHHEDVESQKWCVRHYEEIEESVPSAFHGFRSIFVKHLDVIDQFGRFPHRNDVLKRESTTNETKFMMNPSHRFDLAARIDPVTGKMTFGRNPDALWKMFNDQLKASGQFDDLLVGGTVDLYSGLVSQETEDKYRTLFGQLDIDGSGYLDAQELALLFKSAHKAYSMEKLETLVAKFSKRSSNSGGITFEQFVAIMETDLSENSSPPTISEFFDMFNTDGDDQITTEEFYSCVHAMNPRITNPEIEGMLKLADYNSDGIITREEFQKLVVEFHTKS